MKKYVSIFLCLACVLTLVACGKKADPITPVSYTHLVPKVVNQEPIFGGCFGVAFQPFVPSFWSVAV